MAVCGSFSHASSCKTCIIATVAILGIGGILVVAEMLEYFPYNHFTRLATYQRESGTQMTDSESSQASLQVQGSNVATTRQYTSSIGKQAQEHETQKPESTKSTSKLDSKATTMQNKTPTSQNSENTQQQDMPKQESNIKAKDKEKEKEEGKPKLDSDAKIMVKNETEGVQVKKYLIWLCDSKIYCFGLGDRQRGIASAYLLAEVTERQYGIIMSFPANLSDFYQPNIVNWIIPASELEGKTSVEIIAYGPRTDIGISTKDFNAAYPQDIIYVRTNQKWHFGLPTNPHYKKKIPEWAHIHPNGFFQRAWTRLMTPSVELRQYLNSELVKIAEVVHEEYRTRKMLNDSGCCSINNSNVSLPTQCAKILKDKKDTNSTEVSKFRDISARICNVSLPEPNVTANEISNSKGFDKIDLNLVCVHVRVGRSSSLPFEGNIRNDPKAVEELWKFLKDFERKGHHIYLATDSEDIRKEAETVLGDRLHVNYADIVHIAVVQKGQNERMGLKFALMEQLLLTTSCKVLVVSYSGYSMKAAQVRDQLPGGKANLYLLKNGKVNPTGARKLP